MFKFVDCIELFYDVCESMYAYQYYIIFIVTVPTLILKKLLKVRLGSYISI
jgi:hypothetical protein